MKALILAAGRGTRLFPVTRPVDKPLVAVYDKPLIYYPLCSLIEAGVTDILILVGTGKIPRFSELFGDGSDFGVRIQYLEQHIQRGIADAFLLAEDFIANEPICLLLGDNIFLGEEFSRQLEAAFAEKEGATIFACPSEHPEQFGVVEFDENGNALSIEEKPAKPKSRYIIPGAYVYDSSVSSMAAQLKPSARGELEISDLNQLYLNQGSLRVRALGESVTWMDVGSADAVLDAANLIRSRQHSSGQLMGCIEAAAYRRGYISHAELHELGQRLAGTSYGEYLLSL